MSQKLPINALKSFVATSQFNDCFMEAIMKKVGKDIFLNLIFKILKSYTSFIMIYHFYQKEQKFLVEKVVANLHEKKYVNCIRNLEQPLNYALALKKFIVIKFNQKTWLK